MKSSSLEHFTQRERENFGAFIVSPARGRSLAQRWRREERRSNNPSRYKSIRGASVKGPLDQSAGRRGGASSTTSSRSGSEDTRSWGRDKEGRCHGLVRVGRAWRVWANDGLHRWGLVGLHTRVVHVHRLRRVGRPPMRRAFRAFVTCPELSSITTKYTYRV